MERIKASVLLHGLAPDSMMFGEAEVSLVTTDSREVRPGCIFVAFPGERFDGHDFAANNRLLLKNLEGAENRRARFRTVISLILGGEEHLFEGVVEGRIIDREAGHEGFGYDPLFIPDGYAKTFAEMTTDEKNAVSHRARAVRKLAEFLRSIEK